MPKHPNPKKIGKLEWMSKEDLIAQLKTLPMDSSLRVLKVDVTDDDCERSNPGRPTSCAVSTAVRRMLPKASYVCTKHHGLTVTIAGSYLHFAQSNKGSQAIRAFDEKKARPPALTFTLFNVKRVPKLSNERKEQVNEARRKRAMEGRADRVYDGESLRLRTSKAAKKAAA